jgi:hypothetical protein
MTEDKLRELFREMRDEPVPADSRAKVRIGVNREIGLQKRRFGWRLAAACAALAGAGLVAWNLPLVERPVTPVAVVSTPAVSPAAESPQVQEGPVRAVATHHRSESRKRRMIPAVAAPPLTEASPGTVIRIETPDPDVVILLVGE